LTTPRMSPVKKCHWFWFYWLVYTFGLIIASKPLTMFYIITCFRRYFHNQYVFKFSILYEYKFAKYAILVYR